MPSMRAWARTVSSMFDFPALMSSMSFVLPQVAIPSMLRSATVSRRG